MIRNQLLALLMLCFAATLNAAHPYHVSRAEIQYNASRGVFEVAICVWPEDLEKAIGPPEEKGIDLDEISEADRDRLIGTYVVGKFSVRPAGTDSSKVQSDSEPADPALIHWVGSEVSLKQAWLYFEIEVDSSTPQWSFENRMFFEINEEQMNQIQIQEHDNAGQRNPFANALFSRTLSASRPTAIWSKSSNGE